MRKRGVRLKGRSGNSSRLRRHASDVVKLATQALVLGSLLAKLLMMFLDNWCSKTKGGK